MYELIAEVNEDRQIRVAIPETIHTRWARIIILPYEPDIDAEWMNAIAREWQDELADERQDIYTLEDGESVDAAR